MGITYWITGLSGAGKTTVGRLLYNHLKSKKKNVVFLDGDILRQVYQTSDYSREGRHALALQHARLCCMLNSQGIDVVICVIAMYQDVRDWNRKNIENYREIYLNVSIDELIHRDQKGLYTGAIRGEVENVLGINMAYDVPVDPDLEIMNYGNLTPEKALECICKKWML